MRHCRLTALGMLLLLTFACAAEEPAPPAATVGPAAATTARAEESAWGDEVQGLRLRVTPLQREFTRAAGMPLRIEIKNVSQEPIATDRISVVPEIAIPAGPGKSVALAVVERIALDRQKPLAPGETASGIVGLERTLSPAGWEAGTTLQMVVRLGVLRPQRGTGLVYVSSAPVTILLRDPFPAILTPEEFGDTWPAAATLVYAEEGMVWGSTWLRVDGAGHAMVVRAWGPPDNDIPDGIHTAVVPKEKLDLVATLLRRHAFHKREASRVPGDSGQTTVVLSIGGAGARSMFFEWEERDEPALAELRSAMRKVMISVAQGR